MYGYDYEGDILYALRPLKFLHEQDPAEAKRLAGHYTQFVPFDDIYELTENLIWSIFDDVNFETDEEWDATVVRFSHPTINRLYRLSRELEQPRGGHSGGWQRKIHDVLEFFILGGSRSVMEFQVRFPGGRVEIEARLSLDCYEPLLFANSLVDALLYCQRECSRLEEQIRQTENDMGTEQRKEAA